MKFGLEEYSDIIISGLIFAVLLLALFLIILSINVARANRRTKKLWKNTNKDNIESTMLTLLDEMESIRSKIKQMEQQITEMKHVQSMQTSNVGIVRYNAFGDRGNDLSYSIAFLNEQGDGVVISSIYNREQSTTYAKPISAGTSSYTLSAEEVEAIEKAKVKRK